MRRERYIRHYEHNYFAGWVVKIVRRGETWTGYFSDNPCSSRPSGTSLADLGRPEEIGRIFGGFQKYLYRQEAVA